MVHLVVLRRATLLAAALSGLSACYLTHEVGDEDASLPPPGDLPAGIVFDHPTGRFRQVVLTDAPVPCDAMRYTALDATGSLETPVPRWMSLVAWSGGGPSYFFHTRTANIGPGRPTLSIPDAFAPGRVAVGTRIPVTWSADVVTVGHLGGTSVPVYCGVFSLR